MFGAFRQALMGETLEPMRVSLEDKGRPCVRAHAIAVVGPAMGDFNMPSKGEIRDRQDAVTHEEHTLGTPLGKVVRHEDGLYRAEYGGASVLWISPEDRVLQRG